MVSCTGSRKTSVPTWDLLELPHAWLDAGSASRGSCCQLDAGVATGSAPIIYEKEIETKLLDI